MRKLLQPTKFSHCLPRWGWMLGALAVLSGTAFGQVTVTDYSYNFAPIYQNYSSLQSDPTIDQQTGQGADDFVGNGTVYGGVATYGFYTASNNTGVNSTSSMLFRFRFDKYSTVGQGGFGGNVKLGIDANGDGRVDIYLGADDTSNNQNIVYQLPGSGANISPSTSSLGAEVVLSAFSGTNYSYQEATAAIDGATAQSLYNGSIDALLTFSLSFTQLVNAVNAGLAAQGLAQTFTATSAMRFVAFTQTNTNTVNQDVYGIGSLKTYGDDAYSFSDYYTAAGGRVPEPATYAQVGAFLFAGGLLAYRRRKTGLVAARA